MLEKSLLKLLFTISTINIIISIQNNFFWNDIFSQNNINSIFGNATSSEIEIDKDNLNNLFALPEIVFAILSQTIKENNSQEYSSEYEDCVNNYISKIYNESNSNDLSKLYEGSSKGFIELGSYYNCISKNKSNEDEYNFYTVYPVLSHEKELEISKFNKNSTFDNFWIFGFCVNKKINCDDKAFKEIIIKVNKKFNESGIEIFKDYYNNVSHINIINNFKKYEQIAQFNNFKNVSRLFPLIFLVIQILFIIFKIIPVKLFGFCLKRKYIREIKNDTKRIDSLLNSAPFTKKINSKIRECFSISDNFDDLINNKKNLEFFKEEDLVYIKGIRGMGIFFLIFGTTYIYFFNYPICISETNEKKNYLKSGLSQILIIFWRIAPALLLSASGYSLSYKFLNFLDKKLLNFAPDNIENNNLKEENDREAENEDDNNISQKQEKSNVNISEVKTLSKSDSTKNNGVNYTNGNNSNNDSSSKTEDSNSKSYLENTLGIKFYQNDISKKALNKMFYNQRVNDQVLLSKIPPNNIPYSIFFNFLFRHIDKLFCLYIGITFFLDFLRLFFTKMSKGAPLMNYLFTEIIDKLGVGFGNFFFYKNFIDIFERHNHKELNDSNNSGYINFLQVFSILVCEFNYFPIGSFLVFICFKKRMYLDYILLILIVIFLIFKIIYNFKKQNNNPGMFYFKSEYQKFFFNPIFNFSYYLIGMLFGILNYVVQNDIIKKDSFIKERPFVDIPIFISKSCDYKKKKNIVHFVLSLIFLLIFLVFYSFLFSSEFETIIENDKPSNLFRFISSIDIEVFLYFFHFFIMSCYISGRNIFFKFFNSNVWLQLTKLYFWIILFTSLINYYIIYHTETQVNLGLFIVMIYGAISLANIYLVSLIFCIIFELPYKKLIKLYFNISSKINKNIDDEEDNEEDNDYKKFPLQKESVMIELNENVLEKEINKKGEKEEDDDN